jgi:hypothetical protein
MVRRPSASASGGDIPGPVSRGFLLPRLEVAIEVNGEGHGHPEHPLVQGSLAGRKGVTTPRITAIDLRENLNGVTMRSMAAVTGETPSP